MKRPTAAMLFLVLVLCACAGAAVAGGVLRSALDRPDRPPPVILSAGPTLGGSHDYAAANVGFSASILFRPARAAELFGALYDWNTSLVLGGEWRRLAAHRDILTADLVLRRYVFDMRRGGSAPVLFVGAGGGLVLASFPTLSIPAEKASDPGYGRGEERWWSGLVEVGYEAEPRPGVVITGRAQWRNYVHGRRDYSNYSVHLQVGIPLPW